MLPLQLLTEVAEEYIKRMAKLLHINVEKGILEGESGFSVCVFYILFRIVSSLENHIPQISRIH